MMEKPFHGGSEIGLMAKPRAREMQTMKVVHLNTHDSEGGAACAAYRLNKRLQAIGHDSQLMVGFQTLREDGVDGINNGARPFRGLSDKILDRIGPRLEAAFGWDAWSYRNSWHIPRIPAFREADMVNLHNMHGGYFNPRALPMIVSEKPVVWTLHDVWSFTGHCAISYGCEKFIDGCDQSCPSPDDYPSMSASRINGRWLMLKRLFKQNPHLTAVTPSRWMAGQAQKGFWKNHRVEVIPNGIDLTVFTPLDKQKAREALGLPEDGQFLLFCASEIDNPGKGGSFLIKSFQELKLKNLRLLTFGRGDIRSMEKEIPVPVISLGPIQNDPFLRLAYSAADVLAFPTLSDNLPNTVIESMACGTPAVAFDTGGVPEIIEHMETGYLAKYKDSQDLAKGLNMILSDDILREKMSRRGVEVASEKYNVSQMTKRYVDLYREVVEEFSRLKIE